MSKTWSVADEEKLVALVINHSHDEIAKYLGKTKGSIRNKCWRLGLVDTSDHWNDDQIDQLRQHYKKTEYSKQLNLDAISLILGKLKSNVCRKAKELGLTNNSRNKLPIEFQKIRVARFKSQEDRSNYMSSVIKNLWKANGHPKGALGMKHSDKTKEIISAKSKLAWENKTDDQKQEMIVKQMKTRVKNGTDVFERPGASWKSGWREIGGIRKYYRSKWEANYAYYLQWLKEKGQISDWLHEPITFWFEGVKRGCVSYLPDFWVQELNGAESYHEVKGWMDDRSKTKIKRMAKYHPKVKLIVIDSKGYASLKKSVQGLVPGWEV